MNASSSLPQPLQGAPALERLAPLCEDLGLGGEAPRPLSDPGAGGETRVLVARLAEQDGPQARTLEALLSICDEALSEDGALFLVLEGERSELQLAQWRNALWPLLHANVLYTEDGASITRRSLSGTVALEPRPAPGAIVARASVLFLRRRTHAMGPDATIEKFDQNAAGWNGDPASASYPHFRWMRRFVACFAELPRAARILDFGCGAGWCGIEAAKRFEAAELAFFDPSPQMVKIAQRNAREAGIAKATGRTGFGEQPPFPGPGEEPFDGVISSGVISFAPEPRAWLAGLMSSVRPGGTLVIGDMQLNSRGMRRRRREKALLPARELNARSAQEVRGWLEQAGLEWTGGAGYQLTRPFPEAMHVNETKLGGLLSYPLLWSNQLAAAGNRALGLPTAEQFDSWVMSFVRRK